MGTSLDNERLARILRDSGLAQFGDSLVNFAYSVARTDTTGKPTGVKVQDRVLAEAAAKAGLRKFLPRRVGRGEVANSLEALLAHSWLQKQLVLDDIVACLKEDWMIPTENFRRLAELALARLEK